ncbi:PKAR, partial [Symbiodinium sp. KB8]
MLGQGPFGSVRKTLVRGSCGSSFGFWAVGSAAGAKPVACQHFATSKVIEATKFSGAVRHGAECFNFYFPQELDSEYLIIWDGFDGKPWAYRDAS